MDNLLLFFIILCSLLMIGLYFTIKKTLDLFKKMRYNR